MRLYEFDDGDRLNHKTADRQNRTVEQRLSDLENQIINIKPDIERFSKLGRSRTTHIKIMLDNIIDDISEFFDFCNNRCSNDTETKEYADKLRSLYTEANILFDMLP